MVVVATMIGSVAISRGTAKGNPQVSEQVLKAARALLDDIMLAPGRKPAPAEPDAVAR